MEKHLEEICKLLAEHNAIALESLELEKEKWADSQDIGRMAAKILAAQTRIPEVVALWNREHPLAHERLEPVRVMPNGQIVPEGIKLQS